MEYERSALPAVVATAVVVGDRGSAPGVKRTGLPTFCGAQVTGTSAPVEQVTA